jgi:DNA (cytosine-5)-methyltransferase 1
VTLKLGSLFDGSGGFPLAGVLHGVEPVWASEIEPYPIKVTKARFPGMKHLGSVLDVNGAEVEPVDIITFGSPCQDLSVAGKQAGLHKGERSNLFFEAIRIIKEMREAHDGLYPRVAIWENVPGAFSSNKGADFQAVLEAFAQVCDPTAHVPMPERSKWHPSGAIVGNGWSIAWRTLDAQYWGVPQRRRRIYLIADFGSERAGEILFEQEGVRGDSAESGTAGQSAAGDPEGSAGRGGECLTPWDVQSRRINAENGTWPAIYGGEGGGHGYVLQGAAGDAEGGPGGGVCAYDIGEARLRNPQEYIELSPTLTQRCGTGGNNTPAVCYAVRTRNTTANGIGVAEEAHTQAGANGKAVCFQACGDRDNPNISVSDKAYCIPANPMSDRGQAVCFQQNQREEVRLLGEKTGAIAANGGAHQTNYIMFKERAGCPGGGKGILCGDKPFTLSTLTDQAVCYAVDQQGGKGGANYSQGIMPPLLSDSHGTPHGVCYAYDQYNGAISEKQPTLGVNCGMSTGRNGVCYAAAFKYGNSAEARGIGYQEEISPTLQAGEGGNQKPVVCYAVRTAQTNANGIGVAQDAHTLDGANGQAVCYPINTMDATRPAKPPRKYIIRRLTPLECLRLQGLPDGWLDGVDGSDSAKYKMLGNGIAMPNAIYVVGCAVQLLQEGKHENEG